MAALDWVFVAVLLASMLIGAWRGLVYEVLSVVGWVAAFFVAQWFAADVAEVLPMGESASSLRYAAGFVVVFVAAVFVCGFFAWLGKKLVEAITRVSVEVLGGSPESVDVLITDVPAHNWATGGKLWSERLKK